MPGDNKVSAHVAFEHVELSGHDASPSGISYHWWMDPTSIPIHIAEMQKIYADYQLWLVKELARYQAEGSPISDEQRQMIDDARAKGLLH